MNTLKLQIDKEHYSPGEEILATVSWHLGDTNDKSIEVHLFWFTEGRGDEDMTIVESVNVPIHAKTGSKILKFIAPKHPYSFLGNHIMLNWSIEALAPESKYFASESFYITPFKQKIIF